MLSKKKTVATQYMGTSGKYVKKETSKPRCKCMICLHRIQVMFYLSCRLMLHSLQFPFLFSVACALCMCTLLLSAPMT